jgi:hypothetical protein
MATDRGDAKNVITVATWLVTTPAPGLGTA